MVYRPSYRHSSHHRAKWIDLFPLYIYSFYSKISFIPIWIHSIYNIIDPLCPMMREASLETLPNVNILDPSHDKNLPIMFLVIWHNIFLSFSVERYALNLSKATPREILRREVCHRLALGRVTRSSLIKHLAVKDHVSYKILTYSTSR